MATRYRDLAGPERVQVGLPDSGGVDLATRLSRAAKGVGDIAQAYGSDLAAQEGAKAGARDVGAPREGLSSTTPFGRAYNSSAEAAYSAKVQTDIQTTVERLADEHEADPDGLQYALNSYGAAIHDSVPEAYRPQVAQMLRSTAAVGVSRARSQLKMRTDNQTVADYMEGADSALKLAIEMGTKLPGAEGDDFVVRSVAENLRRLEVMAREGLIQPTDVVKYDNDFRAALDKGLTDAPVNEAIERLSDIARVDVKAAANAMDLIWDSDLTQEQKTAIQAGFEKLVSDVHSINSRVFAEDTARLNERLASGDDSMDIVTEARRLYRNGALTVDGYESARAARVRNAKENADKADDISAVQVALEAGVGLDPTDNEARKAVTTLFDASVASAGYKPGSLEWQTVAVDTFRRTNILPSSAMSWARVSMLSDDPLTVATGAQFYRKAQQANLTAAPYTAEDQRLESLAYQVDEGITAGVDPISVVGTVQKIMSLPKEQRDLLERKYTVIDKAPESNLSALQSSLNSSDAFDRSWTGGAPSVPIDMEADYNQRVHNNYMLNGGNLESARKQAFEQVARVYRYTTINGKPELVKWGIPVGEDEAIRQDLNTSLDSVGFTGDKGKVRIVPNSETERSRGVFWSLVPEDENGFVFDVVRGPNNRPLLYAVPGKDAFAKAKEGVRQRKLSEAGAARAEQQKIDEQLSQYPLATPGVPR